MASSAKGKKNKKKSTSNPPIATPVSTMQYGTGVPVTAGFPAQPLVQPVFQPMGQPGPFPTFTTYPGQPGFGMQPVPAMAGVPPGAPGPGPVRPAQPKQQLEFNKAMSDFQRMFPKMDRDVIETVLRSNDGKVDETVDQLLKLNADIPDSAPALQQPPSLSQPGAQFPANSGLDQPPPYSPPEPDSPFSRYNTGTPTTRSRTSSVPPPQTSITSLNSLPYYPIESPPTPTLPPSRYPPPSPSNNTTASRRESASHEPGMDNLSSDFMRLSMSSSSAAQSRQQELAREAQQISKGIKERLDANKTRRWSVDQHDVETQQIVEDERIALMLQNEEFLQQLQRNPEFMSALERDYQEALQDDSQRGGTAASSHSSSHGQSAASAQDKRSSRTSVDMTNRPLPSTPGPEPPAKPVTFRGNSSSSRNSSSSFANVTSSNDYETPMTREEIEFRNKLSHMGKTSKTKLSFLAGKFNKKKKVPQKYEADPGPVPLPVPGTGERIYEELAEVDQTTRNHHQYMARLDLDHSSC